MGRKLHRKVATRPRPSLPTIFECPRCEAEAVKIEIKENPVSIATVMCGNCHITKSFTELKRLYDKVDIYGIWVDNYYDELEKGEISEDYETETSDTDTTDKNQSKEQDEGSVKEIIQTSTEDSSKTKTNDEDDDSVEDDDLDDDDSVEDDYKKQYNLKVRK